MAILRTLLMVFIWPGNRFCERLGTSPHDDSGMLRGFINSIVWGGVISVVLWNVL